MWKAVIALSLCLQLMCSIQLGNEEEKQLRKVLETFELWPMDGRYDSIYIMPNVLVSLFPKLFIWCPMRHYGIEIHRPKHGCPLKVGKWTDILHKESPRNPRLIYDLGGNIILVQVYYECDENLPGYTRRGHRYLSASPELISVLPHYIRSAFTFVMQKRSGFSLETIDFITTGLYQGQSFKEMAEGIATMNLRAFTRRHYRKYNSQREMEQEYSKNILYSFPGCDKVMEIFLATFEQNKENDEKHMKCITGRVLSCDHTFRISKYIGVTREDGKFNRQFDNVVLGMNERGEVMVWRFTKSTSSAEILDLLQGLKQRLENEGVCLEMVIVDDCCQVRNLYNQVFQGVLVKLDVFHAVARVVSTIPKKVAAFRTFSNKFSLIFLRDGDLGDEREQDTPETEDIEANLERLLFEFSDALSDKTLDAIERLRVHIRKDCLSKIPPGCGTEKNERLHRHLNRSLLCGVSKIGPELAIAALTCALYAWNCRGKGFGYLGKKLAPIPPIESTVDEKNVLLLPGDNKHIKCSADNTSPSTVSGTTKKDGGNEVSHSSFIRKGLVTKVSDILTEDLVNNVIKRLLDAREFVSAFKNKSCNKTMDVISFFMGQASLQMFIDQEESIETIDFSFDDFHRENLERNLSGLKMRIHKTIGDGNCFFRSTVRQLHKTVKQCAKTVSHVTSLGLLRTETEDSIRLRELFVKEITENNDEYKPWMTSDNTKEKIEKFKLNGFFASDVGGLCVKVCTNILKIPIIVVTSLVSVPCVPFLPQEMINAEPLYIAYNHSGAGHYDAVTDCDEEDKTQTLGTTCSCGRKNKKKMPNDENCGEHCTCRKNNRACSRKCRCFNCKNKMKVQTPNHGCHCGISMVKKNPLYMSCKDGSSRKCKCPCVAYGTGCSDICRCINCCNILGSKSSKKSTTLQFPLKDKEQPFSPTRERAEPTC